MGVILTLRIPTAAVAPTIITNGRSSVSSGSL
jgi:hypothetical protein